MGVKGLAGLLRKEAPNCVRNVDMGNRIIAIDAYIVMYQFLTSARDHANALANNEGLETSHLTGVLYRSLRMLESGIKPVYSFVYNRWVFDGKAPKEKEEELKRRAEMKAKVEADIEKALADGDTCRVEALSRRKVKISESHIESLKKLLGLMGIPYLEAASDAEAQCAVLSKVGKVDAVASEDMDTLAFGANFLIRNFTAPKEKSHETVEFDLKKIYEDLALNHEQFVDLCILLGTDYCDTIKGMGPVTALKLIQQFHTIEDVLKYITGTKKYTIPDRFDYISARRLFVEPASIDVETIEFKWTTAQFEELKKFLIEENNFNETRVNNSIERLKKLGTNTKQCRLDSFFTVKRPVIRVEKKQNKQKKVQSSSKSKK